MTELHWRLVRFKSVRNVDWDVDGMRNGDGAIDELFDDLLDRIWTIDDLLDRHRDFDDALDDAINGHVDGFLDDRFDGHWAIDDFLDGIWDGDLVG